MTDTTADNVCRFCNSVAADIGQHEGRCPLRTPEAALTNNVRELTDTQNALSTETSRANRLSADLYRVKQALRDAEVPDELNHETGVAWLSKRYTLESNRADAAERSLDTLHVCLRQALGAESVAEALKEVTKLKLQVADLTGRYEALLKGRDQAVKDADYFKHHAEELASDRTTMSAALQSTREQIADCNAYIEALEVEVATLER